MAAQTVTELLDAYFSAAHDAVSAAADGYSAAERIQLLEPLERRLRTRLDRLPDPHKAAKAQKDKAAEQRLRERFRLHWRGASSRIIIGWAELAKEIKLRENSIRVRLSQGKGSFMIKRTNEATGERDILTVERISRPENKKPVGRPNKKAQMLADPRLGDPGNF